MTGGQTQHGTPTRLGFLHVGSRAITVDKPTDLGGDREGRVGGDKSSCEGLLNWQEQLMTRRGVSCLAPLRYGVLIGG